MIVLQLPENIY